MYFVSLCYLSLPQPVIKSRKLLILNNYFKMFHDWLCYPLITTLVTTLVTNSIFSHYQHIDIVIDVTLKMMRYLRQSYKKTPIYNNLPVNLLKPLYHTDKQILF